MINVLPELMVMMGSHRLVMGCSFLHGQRFDIGMILIKMIKISELIPFFTIVKKPTGTHINELSKN